MTTTQNRTQDATGGGGEGYAADDMAAEIINAELLRRGYRVVAQSALTALLREQGVQPGGLVDQATALRIGKSAGAEALVFATVSRSTSGEPAGPRKGKKTKKTGKSRSAAAGGAYTPGGVVYKLDLTVKMIDAQAATGMWSRDESVQSAPGEKTSHAELLRKAVGSLPFPAPRNALTVFPQKPAGRTPRARPSADPALRNAQGLLRDRGYDPGGTDGRMGQKTRAALRQFQRDQNLPDTGQLDAATKAALQQSSTSSSPPSTSSSPPPASEEPEVIY